MINPKVKEILLKYDEPGRYESPLNFDDKVLAQNVTKLVNDLERHFKFDFKIDDSVQDASFYCDIELPTGLVLQPLPSIGYAIRISNFGRLATINFEEAYSIQTVSDIKSLLKQHDFVYLNAEEIQETYDGQFEGFKKILGGDIPTWYVRYFDYL